MLNWRCVSCKSIETDQWENSPESCVPWVLLLELRRPSCLPPLPTSREGCGSPQCGREPGRFSGDVAKLSSIPSTSLRAKRSNPAFLSSATKKAGLLRRCAPRNDDVQNAPSRSRGAFRPRLAGNFPCPPIRGRRESRVRAAPAVSCAKCTRKNAHEHTGPAEASDFPCAVVLRLIRTLPGDRAFLPPSPARLSANLTPASGCQDHTISPSASSALVRSAIRVHRIPAPRW